MQPNYGHHTNNYNPRYQPAYWRYNLGESQASYDPQVNPAVPDATQTVRLVHRRRRRIAPQSESSRYRAPSPPGVEERLPPGDQLLERPPTSRRSREGSEQPHSVSQASFRTRSRFTPSRPRLITGRAHTASIAPSDSVSRKLAIPTSLSGALGDEIYQYEELGSLEFRLLKIMPARMSTVKCEMIYASLKNPPRYIALSYAWGDLDDVRIIQLGGCNTLITSSLHGALEAVRGREDPVLVWADALCINQDDSDERTEQVQLMSSIYRNAEYVVIWLGPEEDESSLAMNLLGTVANWRNSPQKITALIASRDKRSDFTAVAALFQRPYWTRLWVVQEVLNAADIVVYCGRAQLSWSMCKLAFEVFKRHKQELDDHLPSGLSNGKHRIFWQGRLTFSQALLCHGPESLLNRKYLTELREGSLLEVLRACRKKHATDPRDKVFGILGILTEEERNEFPVDYNFSVKKVYTDVVDYILKTSECVDVICEAIYFPFDTSPNNLPTWVPDWSHIPNTAGLGMSYEFFASDNLKSESRILDDRRNKLEISAIYIDTIRSHGIAVSTFCTLADFLMAFLHWRALLLDENNTRNRWSPSMLQEIFCRTLCLGQVPPKWAEPYQWQTICYHVFASLINDQLPYLTLDRELEACLDSEIHIGPESRRSILDKHFGAHMMGRCICVTESGEVGMGSGFMAPGDLLVVPLGCYTPIILRAEGNRGEYRLVGDVYIDSYMYGRAVTEWTAGKRRREQYILH